LDPLSDILDSLSLTGQFYYRACLNSPWGIAIPEEGATIRFHYAVQGDCYISAGDAPPIHLQQGDLMLIPGGGEHILTDIRDREPVDIEAVKKKSGYNGGDTLIVGEGCGDEATQLLCGHFAFAEGSNHPLLRSLPKVLHVSARLRANTFWLDEALRLMGRQVSEGNPGSMAVLRRMSEIIFIETIRCCSDQSEHLSGLIQALSDPKISRALEAMHRDVATLWTVGTLANEAAMSRSRFADKFQDLVGCGPLTYLAEWRLQTARRLLQDRRVSIQEIAGRIGYQSPAAFTRAFANMFGESPSGYRTRTTK
jgi:AraC-like DNA-binding protein